MSISVNWNFTDFNTVVREGENSNVIKSFKAIVCVESDTVTSTNLDGTTGANLVNVKEVDIQLPSPEGNSFISFESITSDNLKTWVLDAFEQTESDFIAAERLDMEQREASANDNPDELPDEQRYINDAPPNI